MQFGIFVCVLRKRRLARRWLVSARRWTSCWRCGPATVRPLQDEFTLCSKSSTTPKLTGELTVGCLSSFTRREPGRPIRGRGCSSVEPFWRMEDLHDWASRFRSIIIHCRADTMAAAAVELCRMQSMLIASSGKLGLFYSLDVELLQHSFTRFLYLLYHVWMFLMQT